jgi:hypothetical protein
MRVVTAEEPLPPLRRRGSFAADPSRDPPGEPSVPFVRVYVAGSVRRELASTRAFSLDAEEGGFLFGRVYRDEVDGSDGSDGSPGYLVEVTHAVPAEHTGASSVEVTFTGESFAAMRRRLDELGGAVRLAGWYHTHLFPASSAPGLSTVDLELHFTTFRIPWQIAGLVNLDPARDPEGRVIRFYARRERAMVRCPEEVLR